ncbi:MAG: class I SAM-dependent methyltransferase [Acidimicrobiales bacterium]
MAVLDTRARGTRTSTGFSRSVRSPQPERGVAQVVAGLLGADLPVALRAYDGSRVGPDPAPATIVLHSPDALRRIVTAPGELGLSRAYVSGDVDLEGNAFAVLELRHHLEGLDVGWRQVLELLRIVGLTGLKPLPAPAEEARPRGRLHSRRRDASDVSHHYDVGNEFYELLLGPSMTYSCGVWADGSLPPPLGLEEAQFAKYELICRKLALEPGMRLLDVGCGWGGMVRHAARHHGVRAVGITVSTEQAGWARQAVEREGLADRVEIRLQDYRDVRDGPYDAISSIGMFEHVGRARLRTYMQQLHRLLVPEGRLLNHAISRPPGEGERIDPKGFMGRYVFPDGELIEVGAVVTALQQTGLEVRHVESLREHYALTLRSWLANLEDNWDRAVELVGAPRARIWRLYLAGSAVYFEDGLIGINQVLAVKPNGGRSGLGLRPTWDATALDVPADASDGRVIVLR